MTERVAVITPDGKFGTIDAEHSDSLVEAGGRVLSKAQAAEKIAEERTQAAYDAQPTWKKVATVASMAGPIAYPAHLALRAQGATLDPHLEAYIQGVSEGMTGNLASVGLKEAVRVAGGDQAAKAYAQTAEDVRQAHPEAFGGGVVAGLVGGAVAGGPKAGTGALGKIIPGVGIGAVGNVVEQATGRALAGVAERGVLGRAAATAGSMAARGAAEGALINATATTGDALLQGRSVDDAAEKLWAATGTGALAGLVAGGVLGGAGSLARSAFSGAAERTGLARALTKAEPALGDVAADTEMVAAKPSGKPVASVLEDVPGKPGQAVRDVAYDRAWRAGGGRKAFAAEANKYLPNGTNDVGEAFLRHGVIDVEGGYVKAGMNGTPGAILDRIEGPLGTVGKRLGEIADTSGGRIQATQIMKVIDSVAKEYESAAATRPVGRSIRSFGAELIDSLGIRELDGVASVKDAIRERKAIDRLVFQDAPTLDPRVALEAKRSLRNKFEEAITDALDGASGKVTGELKAEYQSLKHDYQALRIGRDAAQDAVDRGAANRTFSLTDKIVGSAVGGAAHVTGLPGLIAGPAAAGASKMIRERADAVAAVFLHRMADSAAVARAITHVEDSVGKAAKAITAPPTEKALGEPSRTALVVRAQQAMQRAADAQADPQGFAQRITQQTAALGATHPELAQAYVQQQVTAAGFLASKMPPQMEPDPLDPHPAPKMTSDEAHRFMRYVEYVDRPMKFFDDLQRGKLTFEGAEVARTLMPRTFAALQARTVEVLSEMKTKPAWQQRQMLGLLLDIPANVNQRPEHSLFLQSLVQGQPGAGKMPANAATAPPRRPIQSKTQQSALDRIAAK